MWRNLGYSGRDDGTSDGLSCDMRTKHLSSPVGRGEKYAYQRWFSVMPTEAPMRPMEDKSSPRFPSLVLCDNSLSCREYWGVTWGTPGR